MMSGSVYSNDIQCIFNEFSDGKNRVNVDEIIIIDSRLEEKTSYNTFNIQVEAISPTSKSYTLTNHRFVYVKSNDDCNLMKYYLAERDGVVFGFESLAELEDGTYSERIGFVEGGRYVVDEDSFESYVIFTKHLSPLSSTTDPIYFEKTEIFLKRIY